MTSRENDLLKDSLLFSLNLFKFILDIVDTY